MQRYADAHGIHRLTQICNCAIIFSCIDESFERLKSLDELVIFCKRG